MSKVFSMGECLIDFMPLNNNSYEAKPGGAPANVAACVAKLGGTGCYLGRVSTDMFGDFLMESMNNVNIKLDYVKRDKEHKTALAFVTLKNGERSFSFYRDNTADLNFSAEDIDSYIFEKGDILHFCSLGLSSVLSRKAHARAVMQMEKVGGIVSFDLNMRENLWHTRNDMLDAINGFIAYPDILKLSDDELIIMCPNCNDEKKNIEKLFSIADNCKIIIVTKGADGATAYNREMQYFSVPAISGVIVDTTGAGDSFIGAILYKLSIGQADLTLEGIKKALNFAVATSTLVCRKKGAMNSMPSLKDVNELLNIQ